jgi:hypothetical protein
MHVNNGLIVGKSRVAIFSFLADLKKVYSLKINEQPTQHLGYTFGWRPDGSLYIHQSDFAQKILDEFEMSNANPVKEPSPLNFQLLHYKKICFNCHQLTCSYFAFTSAVTSILLKEHFKTTSMHSNCARKVILD